LLRKEKLKNQNKKNHHIQISEKSLAGRQGTTPSSTLQKKKLMPDLFSHTRLENNVMEGYCNKE
jgi:hypothetical protein